MKRIAFLTGTRADFGKIKSLLQILQCNDEFEPHIFVTGMHLLQEYGYTFIEIEKTGFKNISTFQNFTHETTMDLTLAKTIEGFSTYIKKIKPDLIVVHGDRVEALAGAIVGSLNNILVAHIEGGELSGTVDELIRHSVSKLSHIHFVSNQEAKKRLLQMGEIPSSVFIIGSPDIDIMFSKSLPSIAEVKTYYEIPFQQYAIAMFHPVTTEIELIEVQLENYIEALLLSEQQYVVIYPNNDLGSSKIIESYHKLREGSNFRVLPSLRFEYFLTLLKNSDFIIGNSSAGVREAPYYGVPALNIGTRQKNRVKTKAVFNCGYQKNEILDALKKPENSTVEKHIISFGNGKSAEKFLNCLTSQNIWQLNHQKQFKDFNFYE